MLSQTTISTTLHTQLWRAQNQPKRGPLRNLARLNLSGKSQAAPHVYKHLTPHHPHAFTQRTAEHSHHIDNTSSQDHHATIVIWIE